MNISKKIRNTINSYKSIDEQLDSLAQFDNITDAEIREIGRTCHKSTEAGILIEYLGFEKLKPHLPLFLEFLQDLNWPAARGASKMLNRAGKEIVPEIQNIFTEVKDDAIWHYWILVEIVQNLETKLIGELKASLLKLIERADEESASIYALRILKEKKLISEDEIEIHYQYLLQKYEGNGNLIFELNDEINPSMSQN